MTRPSQLHPALWTRLAACVAAFLIAALAVFAASPELHAWLHGHGHEASSGESAPAGASHDDDDGCVVTLFAQGLLAPGLVAFLLISGQIGRAAPIRTPDSIARSCPRFLRLPSQAPPLGLA